MQMICALLVFQTPRLPAPLGELSPGLDWQTVPREELFARLAAQPHRRIIKSHTPLDGIPADPRATYIVVARHPLDMAVSLYHQGSTSTGPGSGGWPGSPSRRAAASAAAAARLADRLDPRGHTPRQQMDSLPGVLWHLTGAWARRGQPNIVLAHYDDLSATPAARCAAWPAGSGSPCRRGLARAGPGGHVRGDAGPATASSGRRAS